MKKTTRGGFRGTQGRKPLNGNSADHTQRITISLTFDELCKLAALSLTKKNGKPNYSEGVRRLIKSGVAARDFEG